MSRIDNRYGWDRYEGGHDRLVDGLYNEVYVLSETCKEHHCPLGYRGRERSDSHWWILDFLDCCDQLCNSFNCSAGFQRKTPSHPCATEPSCDDEREADRTIDRTGVAIMYLRGFSQASASQLRPMGP